ncbi:MAG: stalk domain-containing protein [Oscillospiraceae bacterium]|nr:stalk domain-containing protein [Oscillospiraceae bacterium]
MSFAAVLPTYAAGDVNSTFSAGVYSSTAITTDGSLWAWGVRVNQLNKDESYEIPFIPTKIMDSVRFVSAGVVHSHAIAEDGSLWAWGLNISNLLGDGTDISRFSPVWIMDDVTSVSAGPIHSLAVKTDGSLWAWGSYVPILSEVEAYTNSFVPTMIMDDVASAVAGGSCSFVIKTDGSLWSWGRRNEGMLGDGTAYDRFEPVRSVPIKIMDNVVSVHAGLEYSIYAIKTDGSLWAWGNNDFGQLGDGTTTSSNSPIKIMDNVSTVSSGAAFTMAVKTDGSLWAWGNNNQGQLGDGTTTNRLSPVWIMNSVASVSCGGSHALAVKTDGSLWAWGSNDNGILGDGTGIERHTPIKIMENVQLPANSSNYIKVLVDYKLMTFESPPLIRNGRTMVPMMTLLDEFGYLYEYNIEHGTIKVENGETTLIMSISNYTPTINGEITMIDQPCILVNGVPLVPLRFIAETFGCMVEWNPITRTVIITK